MLAICTRTRNEDYEFRGDVNAYNNFKERISQFNFLYDTTKPLAILDGEALFVAGIVTGRKDKVNTVIRYSLFYSGEKSRALFFRFREALKRDKAKTLGDKLDTFLMLNNEHGSLDFNAPYEETFLRFLDTALPESSPDQIGDFAIWTVFCPSERSDQAFKSFLLSKYNVLPRHGTIEVDSLTRQNFSDLTQKKTPLAGRSTIISTLILLCGVGLGFVCATWVGLSVKLSQSLEIYQKKLSTQTQKTEVKDTPQATGMIILWENQMPKLSAILMEKNLQEMPSHMEMRLQIPFLEADTAVILIPVYSPTRTDHQLPEKTIIRQEGPVYLLPCGNVKQKELTPPTETTPAAGTQEMQRTPETTEISSQKADQETRPKKAEKK